GRATGRVPSCPNRRRLRWRRLRRRPGPWRSPASLRRASDETDRCVRPSGLADDAFGQILAEYALVIFGDQRALGLVALVEEADAEGVTDVAEDMRVLRPADHCA